MFIVENHLGDLELDKKETNGMRLYKLPNGDWVPSITSVTSFYNRDVFIKWRQRVGDEEAQSYYEEVYNKRHGFSRSFAQAYLENRELKWDDYLPATRFMFHHAKPYLDKIGTIHAIERTLYSEYLGLAGEWIVSQSMKENLQSSTSRHLTRSNLKNGLNNTLSKRLHMRACITN